jgi:HSP20 family protein
MNRFDALRQELDRVFDTFGVRLAEQSPLWQRAFPPLNVWDGGGTICVEAEVPGLKKDDLEILAVGNELTIKGHRRAPAGEQFNYHRRECGVGEFTRTVTLPVEVSAERIDAVLAHGVLTLRLPKAEAAMPKRITVKAN